jgi:hypothetical protein
MSSCKSEVWVAGGGEMFYVDVVSYGCISLLCKSCEQNFFRKSLTNFGRVKEVRGHITPNQITNHIITSGIRYKV